MASYSVYHIDSTTFTQTDISDYVKDCSDIPLMIQRNSDFSLILEDINLSVLSTLSADIRKEGEYIGFKKDTVFIQYYEIVESIYNPDTKLYDIKAEHIFNKLKLIELSTYINSTNITSTDTNSGYYNGSAQIVLKSLPMYKCLEYSFENFFTSLITTLTFEYETAGDQTTLEGYFCLEAAVEKYKSETDATLWDFLNQTIRAFGYSVRIADAAVVLRRHTNSANIATYTASVAHDYADFDYNAKDTKIIPKLKNITQRIVNDLYYRDLVFYEKVVQVPSFMEGLRSASGWISAMKIQTAQETGLGSTYTKARLYSQNASDINHIDSEIDEDFDYRKTFNPNFSGYFNPTGISKELHLGMSADGLPRVTIKRDMTGDITEGITGQPIISYASNHRLNRAGKVTIAAGAYAGEYYGTPSELGQKWFIISSDTVIRLYGVAYTSDDSSRSTSLENVEIIKRIEENEPHSNTRALTLYISYPPVGDLILENANWTNPTTGVVNEYDGEFEYDANATTGTDYIGKWNVSSGKIIMGYTFNASHYMTGYRLETSDDISTVTKPSSSNTIKQVSFPKHFFFYTGSSTTGGLMHRLLNGYPVDNTNTLRLHLLANPDSYRVTQEEIDVDDTVTVDAAPVMSIKANVDNMSLKIKQQRFE